MASRNDHLLSQPISAPSSRSATPHPTRPPAQRLNSGKSTLRSAEEQLRDIRQGDTSWQRTNSPLPFDSPRSRQSNSSSSVDKLDEGDDRATREPQIRVYLHHVQKTDTMPLILLAYEISASVLKKSNRLWAADSIQSREKLYLPVDECGVIPVPCSPPLKPKDTLLNGVQADLDKASKAQGENGEWPPRLPNQSMPQRPPAAAEAPGEWVMIPGIGPIQIVSLSAQKLSYFPRPHQTAMERSSSLPSLDSLVGQDKAPRDSMDSVVSRSSIGSLVEDGVGRIIRFWHDNQGRKKWAKIGRDSIEL
jgi:hypothetical protein